jgi:hypothetical protein
VQLFKKMDLISVSNEGLASHGKGSIVLSLLQENNPSTKRQKTKAYVTFNFIK